MVQQDISKLKQNEIELSEAKKRYSELFHLSPLPMWVYDIETLEFLDVNEAAEKHYGYTKEEFKKITLRDIRPKQDLPAFEKQLELARKTPRDFMSGVFRHIKKDGEIIDVDVQSNYILYKGRHARVILVNDITDRLEYISAIETKNKELQDIAWLQSHVMRAPVAKIMGIIHLLQRLDLDEVEKSILLNDLNACASELDQVIHDIAAKTHHARLK
ncbi:PAS domain S-box protein [Sediminibacterium sp. C3]|uniref:PAS domain-containing protein n=1 Tax=Sediminibacterium sp. C3 TaxID=1267211 RepID=UPI0004254CAA|nr:PAS domain S-box protein [Sediminibacterium sp. C3]